MASNKKPVFRSRWKENRQKAKILPTKMTVPGLGLTTTQHLKKIKQGIPEATMKVIYDPDDLLPDTRVMDLTERAEAMKTARQTVADIMTKKKEFDEKQKQLEKEKLAAEEQRKEKELLDKLEKRQKEAK